MIRIQRKALVLYSAMDMYRLVEDVPRYPEFLSWCDAASLDSQSKKQQVATLEVAFGGLRQSFTTANRMQPGQGVHMSLRDGPFRSLEGQWQFKDLGEDGSRVSLSLEFEFAHSLLSMAFERGFAMVAEQLVRDFSTRAEAVYG